MLTLQALKDWGANVDEGMQRCLNNEAFYLRMVGKIKDDAGRMDALGEALAQHDYKTAFEHAHALKGVMANLSLTPVLVPVQEMTELLRNQTEADYSAMYDKARLEMNALLSILT